MEDKINTFVRRNIKEYIISTGKESFGRSEVMRIVHKALSQQKAEIEKENKKKIAKIIETIFCIEVTDLTNL